jgi:hypothetical protein
MGGENHLWSPKRRLIPAEGINYPFNPVVDFFSRSILLYTGVGIPGVLAALTVSEQLLMRGKWQPVVL